MKTQEIIRCLKREAAELQTMTPNLIPEAIRNLEELQRWHTCKVNNKIKNPFANVSTLVCPNCTHKDEYIEELESEVEGLKDIKASFCQAGQSLLTDGQLYDAFVASVKSALIEAPADEGMDGLAKFIADRIIGREMSNG